MKKILFLLLFAVGYVLPSVAQQDYKDLLNYFVDEKYEKVLSKAEIYMAGEKTK